MFDVDCTCAKAEQVKISESYFYLKDDLSLGENTPAHFVLLKPKVPEDTVRAVYSRSH